METCTRQKRCCGVWFRCQRPPTCEIKHRSQSRPTSLSWHEFSV